MTHRLRSVVRLGVLAGGVGVLAWRRRPELRALAARAQRCWRRELHHTEGRAEGWLYRMGTGGPDPDVSDDVLAERVRATLGPLVRSLDLPHVHVLVERRVALLHGDVGSDADRRVIEAAAAAVAGVAGVESHLHVGLLPGDTRPSAGHQPSSGLTALVAVATHHGGGQATAEVATRAALSTFASLLPEPQLERLRSHLAADVAALLRPPRRLGTPRYVQTAEQLAAAVAGTGVTSRAHAVVLLEHLLPALRAQAPGEAEAVARVLPPDLRSLWEGRQAAAV